MSWLSKLMPSGIRTDNTFLRHFGKRKQPREQEPAQHEWADNKSVNKYAHHQELNNAIDEYSF